MLKLSERKEMNMPKITFGVVGGLAATILAAVSLGQIPPHTKEYSGAKNPEMIPFAAALGELYSRVADGPKAASWKDRVALLTKTGLTEESAAAVINQASIYVAAFSAAQQRMETLLAKKGSGEARKALFEKDSQALRRAFDETEERIRTELGEAGWRKLMLLLDQDVKPTMTLVIPSQEN